MGYFSRSPFATAGPACGATLPHQLCGAHDVEFEVDFPDGALAERFCAILKAEMPEVRASRADAAHAEDLPVVNCSVLIVPNCGSIDDYAAALELNAERLHGHVEGWAIRK